MRHVQFTLRLKRCTYYYEVGFLHQDMFLRRYIEKIISYGSVLTDNNTVVLPLEQEMTNGGRCLGEKPSWRWQQGKVCWCFSFHLSERIKPTTLKMTIFHVFLLVVYFLNFGTRNCFFFVNKSRTRDP